MPKFSTFPTLYDETCQLSITKLKQWGYLNPGESWSTTVSWSSNGVQSSRISLRINNHAIQPYIELDYRYGDEPRNYKIDLVSIPSNIGKGKIWYFLCPKTFKRCRKLYCISGYFLHREAFIDCMYESQTRSKKYRQLHRTFGMYFKLDGLYSELRRKHFKKTYAGKPTKKYLMLMTKIEQAERISYCEIEKAIID